MILLFSVTTFLSSFLLFTVQLIVGKRILPWFGGVASVWTATMLFFMSVLFLGYLYVGFLSRFSKKIQIRLHLTLSALGLISVAINYFFNQALIFQNPDWQIFQSLSPTSHILLLVFASIGIPYFLLSTTSTLLQYWFVQANPNQSPYPLYVTSNVGSLLGLLSYPLIFEPKFSLTSQENLWLIFFLVYLLLILVISKIFTNLKLLTKSVKNKFTKLSISSYIPWLALSTTSNIALLATTAKITQSISPIPFLWIVPLALFLISFIIAFSDSRWYSRPFHGTLLLFSVVFTVLITTGNLDFSYWINLGIILFTLFIVNLVCHAELFASRPAPQFLVPFYITISFGGVLASLFCAILAPALFPDLWELPLSMIFAVFLYLLVMIYASENRLQKIQHYVISILAITFILIQFKTMFKTNSSDSLQKSRNFYGILRVYDSTINDSDDIRDLVNGSIDHGFQYLDASRSSVPTSYYQRNSGGGIAIDKNLKREAKQPMRIGVIGLGAGTMAAYCLPGDYFRFYEINPEVISINEKYFTFISHCREVGGKVDIILGDARLSLKNEQLSGNLQKFDILIVDAFTDDAIPVHLLTKEAIKLYFTHMDDKGIIAFHISNRYLSLDKVLDKAAATLGYYVFRHESPNSLWYLMSAAPLKKPFGFSPPISQSGINLWTDDYSNILQIIK